MSWTTPMTFTAGTVLTAANLNTHLRDNLLETAAGKASTAGSHFVATGANAIAERKAETAESLSSQNTSSTSYVDLTGNPQVSRTLSTMALCLFSVQAGNSTANASSIASVAVSGASTVAASDDWCIVIDGQPAGNTMSLAMAHLFTGLTAGSNTFKMRYRVGSGTGTFQRRRITVVPF